MELHNLLPKNKIKPKKRVGRGGKRGTFSGKGSKGQRSRAGHRIRPTERDLIIRIPKLRGVTNKSLVRKPKSVNIRDLDSAFNSGPITLSSLKEKGLIKNYVDSVKILSVGETKKKFEIEGLMISAKAKEKIEAAGGKVSGAKNEKTLDSKVEK